MTRLLPAARLYLIHAALLTFGLSISSLFFNLAIPALGYKAFTLRVPLLGRDLALLGVLNSAPVLVGALLSLPLWWMVTQIGLRPALLLSAVLMSVSMLTLALWPQWQPLLLATALTGPAAVIFQVSAAPFMMNQSTDSERDLLFSLNAGINIGVAGVGSLVGGFVPGIAARLFDFPLQSGAAYRATFLVAACWVLASIVPLLVMRVGDREQTDKGTKMRRGASVLAYPELVEGHAGGSRWPSQTTPSTFGLQSLIARIPEPWQGMVRRPWSVLRFMVSPLLISLGAALLIPYLNLFFRSRFAVPDELMGGIFAALGITTGLATLAAPWLSARLGKMGSVVLTQVLAIPCLLLLGFAPFLGIAISVALFRSALMNMAAPLYDAYAMEQSDSRARPTVIGLVNGAFSVGYIVGPALSVEVQNRYGFGPLFVATAVCYSLAAASNYLLFVHRWPVRHEHGSLVER